MSAIKVLSIRAVNRFQDKLGANAISVLVIAIRASTTVNLSVVDCVKRACGTSSLEDKLS